MGEIPEVMREATIDGLRRHSPFSKMDDDAMRYLAEHLSLGYYAKGRTITTPEHGKSQTLYIIQRGHVTGVRGAHAPTGLEKTVEHHPGECFPLSTVYSHRHTNYVYTAEEDTFLYEVDAEIVGELAHRSPQFKEFCVNRIGSMLKHAYAQMQTYYSQLSKRRQPMNTFIKTLVKKAPVTCTPDEPLIVGLKKMRESKTGSVVIIDGFQVPQGMFTERDLLKITVAGNLDVNHPIRLYMNAHPRVLPGTATAAEAASLMAKYGLRYVIVVEGEKLIGVVSEHDLFALQSMSMRDITHAIELASTLDEVKHAVKQVHKLAGYMIAQGVGAENLTQLIATLNDKICCRILEMEKKKHDLEGIRFCWISLGSEGRLEQTLATDQDNGIIYQGGQPHPNVKERLMAFALDVNNALDACGFPLCKGNIMASNPDCCLSLDEWKAKFDAWIRTPMPQALLNANIFFDLRPLWGDESLARNLRSWLTNQVVGNQRFLRAMAETALDSRPPLGIITDFTTSKKPEEKDTINLKGEGSRIFVDVARIYALAHGIEETGTLTRIRASAEKQRVAPAEVQAVEEAFNFILLLRLRYQNQDKPGEDTNRINPDILSEIDRRILKEAFRQARKLQSRLTMDYQL